MGIGEPTPAEPVRRKLDFLYQEVIGEVSDLLKRLEEVSAAVQEIARSRAGERTAEELERAAAAASSRIRGELERTAELARKRLSAVVGEAASAAATSDSRRRWGFYGACAALALASSLAGGSIVVLAHVVGWW